jgi:hypothetical protein
MVGVSTGTVKTLAAYMGRRLARRMWEHPAPEPPRPSTPPSVPLPQAPREPAADELNEADGAELDALRGALVRELDRLAADDDCSASFRRAG